MKYIVFLLVLLFLQINAVTACGFIDNSYYDENLNDWFIEGASDAVWTFSGAPPVNNTGLQARNTAAPTYLVTNRGDATSMKGNIQVVSTADDDFFGIVFASGTTAIILSWNMGAKTGCGASTNAVGPGTSLLYTTTYGSLTDSCDYWSYSNTVTKLASGQFYGSTPWVANTLYRFTALFSSSHITVYINDQLDFDYDISSFSLAPAFPVDKIGFFGYSQDSTEYSDMQLFNVESIVSCVPGVYRAYFNPGSCAATSFTLRVDFGDSSPTQIFNPIIPTSGLPYFDVSYNYATAGTYVATLRLYQGSSNTGSVDRVSILSGAPLASAISLTPDPSAQCGFSMRCGVGSATLNVNSVTGGGGTPYSASWSDLSATFNPLSTPTRAITSPGTFFLDVTDTAGCTFRTSSVTATRSSFSAFSASLGSQCGSISVSATGTATCQPFLYVWTDSGFSSTSTVRSNLSPGTYTVSAQDINRCTSTSASVTIVDQPPTARCRNYQFDLGNTGSVTIVPSNIDNGSTDPCGMLSLSMGSGFVNGNCASVGTHSSTLVASGYAQFSTDSCTSTVTIVDQVNPVARCQDFQVNFPGTGSYTLNPSSIDNGSSDTCGVVLSVNQTTFNDYGEYFVQLTATDPSGNTDSCVASVRLVGFSISSPVQGEDVFMYVAFTLNVSYYLPDDSTMRVRVIEESSGDVYRNLPGNALNQGVEIVFFKTLPGVYRLEAYSEPGGIASLNTPQISLCTTPYAACNYGL